MKELRSFIAPSLIFTFLINTFGPVPLAQAQEIRLPVPGVMVHISPAFDPPVLKGVTVYPHDPFKFDFILDKGDGAADLNQESKKLVKYFLASMTTPENDLWVNLSPYEKNRIIPDSFGQTDMGRDLLAEDYILKQITASLIYPEGETGKKFWKRVYQEAAKRYGTTDIPVNTFNKVWIVPGHAKVYVHGNTAFVVQASLKVMLEQDYLALSKNSLSLVGSARRGGLNAIGSQIVREIVIPELTKEVNEGKNFAPLRQVYDSLILAVWFKKYMKEGVLGRKYMDQNKVSGIRLQQQAVNVEFIYQRYLKAFKKGVYNYIKEEPNPVTREMMPRKYFSGGWVGAFKAKDIDFAQTVNPSEIPNSNYADVAVDLDSAMIVPKSMEHMAILVSDLFRYMAPTGTSRSVVPMMILSIEQNLKKKFNSMPISDNSKFGSFIYKGKGGEATILVDPDPQRDDPNDYYKIFYGESGKVGLRELSYLKVLKGTPGVPQYLDWGRIGARGVWIHMEGIQNASSITVSDGNGYVIYSEIWKEISPSQRRIALAEVAETLDHIHHRFGFGHGDVKPGNIIIGFDGKKVKVRLIDWGLAKVFDGYLFGKTKGFIAPEWIMHEQTDTYTLGETILESLELEGVPSAPLKELCERMKSSFADDRPSLTEVAQKLREFAQNAGSDFAMMNIRHLPRYPDTAVQNRLYQREMKLRGEITSKIPLDALNFKSYKLKGVGGRSLIFVDPQDRPNNFYKIFWGNNAIRELRNLEAIKGVSGVPQVLEWGIMKKDSVRELIDRDIIKKGGVWNYLKFSIVERSIFWVHMQGIENAESILVSNEKGRLIFSGVWDNLNFSQRCNVLAGIAEILDNVRHQIGIAHSDVKPENILVNERGDYLLNDWELAGAFGEKPIGGTVNFEAPEGEIQEQSDTYALGETILESFDLKDLLKRLQKNVYVSKEFEDIREKYITNMMRKITGLSGLSERMRSKDPQKRPFLTEVARELRDLAMTAEILPYDRAMTVTKSPGGIDLTAKRMDLTVDSDKAAADQLPDMKVLENIEINGIYIKDIEVKPLKNLPELLGVSAT